MNLTQAEADALLAMPKALPSDDVLELTQTTTMDRDWTLFSHDRRELFFLTIERGQRRLLRVKYQTRAREVVVLARLDLNGRPHRNPIGQPYRPGELLPESHLHLYREGFDARVAFRLDEIPSSPLTSSTDFQSLEWFLRFCAVDPLPKIQLGL
jgi:hypothetical protein